MSSTVPAPAVSAATRAVYIAFIASGFGFASWASRIPQVRDALQASPATLGLVLLAVAAGSLIALPLAGLIVNRLGSGRTVALMSVVLSVGLTLVAVGYQFGIAPVVAGLVLVGFGNGAWDVAMNVEGAEVEQHLGRPIMPRFHAGFSVGTVGGALVGAGCVALDVSVTPHLIGVALVNALVVPFAVRAFLPDEPHEHADAEPKTNPLRAWREPRTLLIGLFVLCMAFTEGTGNDWLGVAVIDGYGAQAVIGPLTFALFLAAMTLGRWFGPAVLARRGRLATVRASSALALLGLILVVFGQVLPVAMLGAVLWGVGAALGFPVGMSAAADDPRLAAGRVSVVASIGYVAFLSGPPLIGFLGEHVGVLRALTVAAALLALSIALAGALKDPAPVAPAAAEELR